MDRFNQGPSSCWLARRNIIEVDYHSFGGVLPGKTGTKVLKHFQITVKSTPETRQLISPSLSTKFNHYFLLQTLLLFGSIEHGWVPPIAFLHWATRRLFGTRQSVNLRDPSQMPPVICQMAEALSWLHLAQISYVPPFWQRGPYLFNSYSPSVPQRQW